MLDRLSAEYGFSVLVLNLDTPQGLELAQRAGVMFAPGILIDEEPFSYGRPSERRLRRELDRRTGVARGG